MNPILHNRTKKKVSSSNLPDGVYIMFNITHWCYVKWEVKDGVVLEEWNVSPEGKRDEI